MVEHDYEHELGILEHFGLLVYPRPGATSSPLLEHESVSLIDAPVLNISATFIRRLIKEGKSVNYLLPAPVIDIIDRRHLYNT